MPPADQLTPEALGAWQKEEIGKWSPMIRAANVKSSSRTTSPIPPSRE
jgi:hypothetical protein